MIRYLNGLRGLALGAAALFAATAAEAAPGNPRVVGTATQASGSSASVTVTTSAAINGGDVIMLIAAGELNMVPWRVQCSCGVSSSGRPDTGNPAEEWRVHVPSGEIAQARARTWTTFASQDIAAGTTFTVDFGGTAGAKAVTMVAISGAEARGLGVTYATGGTGGNLATGTGTAIGWTCTSNCSIAASLMMVNASVISGGGSDTYTEDAGWTFLHQSAAGAWPAIRVAYKASGAGGTFSYGLTDGTSRNWISGALLVR